MANSKGSKGAVVSQAAAARAEGAAQQEATATVVQASAQGATAGGGAGAANAGNGASAAQGAAGTAGQGEENFSQKYARMVAYFEANPPPATDTLPGDPAVVMANVRRGWKELAPHLAQLQADPTVKWALVPIAVDTAEAYLFAVDQIIGEKITRERLDAVRVELQKLREPGMLIARGLALLGHTSLERVEAIEAGRGLLDMGRDGIALAALFRELNATAPGTHPFTDERIANLEKHGAWMLRNITPDGTVAPRVVSTDQATRNRDLLWAALRETHGVMRLGAFKVWGERFNDHVPPLGSRVRGTRSDGSEEGEGGGEGGNGNGGGNGGGGNGAGGGNAGGAGGGNGGGGNG